MPQMPLEWKLIKEFTDSKTGFTIRVTRASPGRPLYSLELGRENPMADRDGLVRHVPMRYEVTNGVVTYVSLRDVVSALLEQAEDFVRLDAQERVTKRMESREEELQRRDSREKGVKPLGLKELSKRDATKRKV